MLKKVKKKESCVHNNSYQLAHTSQDYPRCPQEVRQVTWLRPQCGDWQTDDTRAYGFSEK